MSQAGEDETPKPASMPPLSELIDPNRLHELQMEVQLVEQWQFQSPILPPAILKQYAEIIPDFAERYFASWERQTTHRQKLEATVIAAQTRTQLRAQPYTFALGALALVVAAILGITDHETAAVAVVGLDFFGLGGVFVYGRMSNVREARRKEAAVPDPSPPRPSQKAVTKGGPSKPQANRPRKSKKRKRR